MINWQIKLNEQHRAREWIRVLLIVIAMKLWVNDVQVERIDVVVIIVNNLELTSIKSNQTISLCQFFTQQMNDGEK